MTKPGIRFVQAPSTNKGTAFTEAERDALGLRGLLPPRVSTMEQQVARALANVRRQATDLNKYAEMISLLDRNETLFYRVLAENIEELMPIIYTPTVGAACQMYGHIFRRPRGLFISRRDKGRIRGILRNWPFRDVRVIVVTDGERILGLGDLGASGMGIPVGKLSLYTACAGVHPTQTLPITLDVGTNNESLLADPLYLGLPERRLRGPEYDALVDEFVRAASRAFPKALIQFEDFGNQNAFRLLEKYRGLIRTFNDDIQGTAAVTLAGLISSGRISGRSLRGETILFHGAGEAAIGIGNLVVDELAAQGLSPAQARTRCWFMDSKGLVVASRPDLQEHKRPYAHERAPVKDLLSAVRELKPTALIGVCGQARQFTREIVEEMSRLNERPVIFALSNPTANAECAAEDAYAWSGGRAIFASGSPFAPVVVGGRALVPGQANNAYVFPGVGLGVVISGAALVTDEMFSAAARVLAGLAREEDIRKGCLFPPFTGIRETSARIAAAVAGVAYARRLAKGRRPADILAAARAAQYQPVYPTYA